MSMPALTRPVAITRNGRERLVMISVDEYRRLRRRSREVIRVERWRRLSRGGWTRAMTTSMRS
jgi:PHD/YefM family antitoxin component YafN of YafNO toxin-antitoxin module